MESLPQECSEREDRSPELSPMDRGSDPPYRGVEAANDTMLSQLARTIEYEIIPRLMLAHRASGTVTERLHEPPPSFTFDDVVEFSRLVMSHDEDLALGAIQALRLREIPVEHIYTDLLAPTARHLGALWDDDLCNFTDVTVGLGRLQRVLRELSPSLVRGMEEPLAGKRILLLPSPGEQHTFGLLMVGEFFRRAGWSVGGGGCATGADAAAMVAAEGFDVIGFSMGAEVHLAALASTIAAVRHATCNPDLVVLVGGPLFGEHPEFVARLGADGMTIDGREAPLLADRLVSMAMTMHENHG